MDRRTVLALAGAAVAAPHALVAQTAKRVYRIAILDDASDGARREHWASFRRRLGELGYIEGKNVSFDVRYADGALEKLPSLAGQLVVAKPDVIITPGTPPSRAALRATSTIPIVFIGVSDPVSAGLIASLARPGGTVTGLSTAATDTLLKRLEMLREINPAIQRIAYIGDVSSQGAALSYTRLEESARKLKIAIQMLDGVGNTALERSFATIKSDRVQALLVGSSGTLLEYRTQIIQFVTRERLPALYGLHEFTSDGGLLSYGADRHIVYARGGDYVHKILHGAKPATLPVEQPMTIRLVVNMKAAGQIGIKVPEAIRLRADEVIE